MKKDKNGQEIQLGDFILIKNKDEEGIGKMIVGYENKICCIELEKDADRFDTTGCEIDLNKYNSNNLEIVDYEEVEKYFGVD